ncbi:hypothetical protein PVAND_017605 [Polypedilum vanderplanki]|uniref:ATP-dependent DNA helicase n=1 Tax=Polypedilum vanderplanki TaxID=319348 RepID=A0A9J6B9G5_POLVA|nr:hypothetical protein PVAND_017605 [Polypedilum vanderplanki]
MVRETATQRKRRLEKKKEKRLEKLSQETEQGKSIRLEKRRKRQNEASEAKRNAERLRIRETVTKLRANETLEEYISRLEQDRLRHEYARSIETAEQHFSRLEQVRTRIAQTRANETVEEYISRLEQDRLRHEEARAEETAEEYISRLERDRLRHEISRAEETAEEYISRLEQDRLRHEISRAEETAEEYISRLEQDRLRHEEARAEETAEEYISRLEQDRLRHERLRLNETPEEHEARLQRLRIEYAQRMTNVEEFNKTINTFCDRNCDICEKKCYPDQVATYQNVTPKPYLPQELAEKNIIIVCHRCHTHLKSSKTQCPSKAYWNNMRPGDIPDEIKALTKAERRLLSRIIPYVNVIKFDGRFGQYGFKGQATLFALDIFEVTDKLQNILPRSSDDTGLVVITETLENLNSTREYRILRERVYAALHWLIINNPLYHDVTVNNSARLETRDIIRVIPVETNQQNTVTESTAAPSARSAYVPIDKKKNVSRILRASWHQGNLDVFPEFGGIQCYAMVLANIVRAAILPPSRWTKNILDQNMTEGDGIFADIHYKTRDNAQAFPIDGSGYLSIRNLDIIKHDFIMYDNVFALEYDDEWVCTGSLQDNINDGVIGHTLLNAIRMLFIEHNAGVLVCESKSLGLMHYDDKYYFTDSHSCGPAGASAANGKACIIECDTIEELHRIVRRALSSRNVPFVINYIDVIHKVDAIERNTARAQALREVETTPIVHETNDEQNEQHLPVQTSLMAPIDFDLPDVEDVLIENENINEIVRKTNDNIVNVNHEKKAEEYAWFHLFPYGINGLKETRDVDITVLDYYQQRIIGIDPRFQSVEYLFYALSMYEYHRIQSTINACGKKVRGRDGAVEDLHLHMRSLRGSAAYWRTAFNELTAMIRNIGPPTWFITLSCNDLHWHDMIKALLIADGRPDEDPSKINIDEVQRLIEIYPVVLSRHFSRRVKAFMKYIKKNARVLGGKVIDYWWRIEFQKRGSPHLHLVVWIENPPSFETPEGIELIDQVVSCHYPSEQENPELHNLVKKNQRHQHTHTCHKNNSQNCRFAFPRQPSQQTRIVPPSSDEFIRNGGRFCTLKRNSNETYINNYNPEILKLWNANMDIQPCGNNEAIAHYIAKYVAKSEPTDLTGSIAAAIRKIRLEETNISRKLFKICMRILKEREVSAAECAYRLCHLPLRGSSRTTVFLNTRKPEQRYYVLKFEGNEAVGMCSNIFERYEKRPREHPDFDFPNMCLLEFAMRFEVDYKKNDEVEENVDAIEEEQSGRKKYITLTDKKRMAVRKIPAVVRVPYFMMSSDPENYFYSLLLQYKPYYNESELLGELSAREAFLACEETLKERSAFMETFRERDRQLEIAFTQAHAFNLLDNPEDVVQAELEEEAVPEQLMTDEQFETVRNALNVQQRDLFNLVTRSIHQQMAGSNERLKLFVTGGAGVGKTFTFNALKNQINRCYGRQAVKVGAPTGVAARLVGGQTLHALLRLPVQVDGTVTGPLHPLTGNYLKVMRNQWKDIEWVFFDEVSMIGYETFCQVDSRLRQLKKKEDEPFGGLNVIVFGDLLQLPPVKMTPIFDQPLRFLPATHLWRLFGLVELTENMRQQGDTTFVDLLNALRVGELTAQHFQILMSKIMTEEDQVGEFALHKAIRIYPKKAMVAAHNEAVLEYYRHLRVQMYTIKADDTLVNPTRNATNVDINTIVSTDINKTGALPKELVLFVGAKVMLRSNINVETGLVNGAIGTISEIIWPYFRRDQMYDTDIPSVRVDFGRDGIHLIQPRSVQFPALRNYGTIERRMLPLILCWACTAHKMQGCTVDYAVVHLGSELFTKGQAYVALSRVRSLDGLRIDELDCSKLTGKTPCNEDAIKEMERMRQYQMYRAP